MSTNHLADSTFPPALSPLRRKAEELFGIDIRSLAAFRVGMGLVLLLDLSFRGLEITAHSGTQDTGLERTIYGFHWGNALHRDHQLAYQFTAASDFQKLTAHSLVYEIPCANRDILTFYSTYGEVKTDMGGVPLSGFGLQASVRYHRDLPAVGCSEHYWVLGFDAKRTNTDLEFGGVEVFPKTAEVYQLMGKYYRQEFDANGTTSFRSELFFSPGGRPC